MDIQIEDMDFHMDPWGDRMQTRIRNALRRAGIHTLDQLVQCRKLPPGIGIVGAMIVDRKLKERGLARGTRA